MLANAIGEIQWKDDNGKRHWATFAATSNPWALGQGLQHEIYFEGSQQTRFANVLKTVVHVAIDEDANGKAVLDSWKVKTIYFSK